jgi:hypothetical protein
MMIMFTGMVWKKLLQNKQLLHLMQRRSWNSRDYSDKSNEDNSNDSTNEDCSDDDDDDDDDVDMLKKVDDEEIEVKELDRVMKHLIKGSSAKKCRTVVRTSTTGNDDDGPVDQDNVQVLWCAAAVGSLYSCHGFYIGSWVHTSPTMPVADKGEVFGDVLLQRWMKPLHSVTWEAPILEFIHDRHSSFYLCQ